MDERVLQFRIGIVVVAALIITVYLIFLFGEGPSFSGSNYQVYVRFRQAPGVTVGTPVRQSGVRIGRVQNVQLLDNSAHHVLVTIAIQNDRKLTRAEVCRIASDSLLGDAVLEFVPGSGGSPATDPTALLQDGDVITGIVSSNPLEVFTNLEGDLKGAIQSIQQAGDEVRQLASNINSAFGNNEDQLRRIMQKTELTLDQFNSTLTTINDVMGDQEINAGLKKSLQDFPKLVADARATMATMNTTFEGLQKVSTKAERNLDNLEKFTAPLGERGEELVMDLQSTVKSLDAAMGNIAMFTKSVNESDGTIGLLIHDRELYDRLNSMASNLENATDQVQPIMDNFRIFSDKLARDPRQLGLKGMLDRQPQGFKPMLFNGRDLREKYGLSDYDDDYLVEPIVDDDQPPSGLHGNRFFNP
ncbi:MAG: phospholipid/cholesterol/gamma-HCH transport system substrate-binding protein [Pirellulaceae bacterium]|jgi:phospholipid/cholesterol/gamma-HCH transport system substrate-binding protein